MWQGRSGGAALVVTIERMSWPRFGASLRMRMILPIWTRSGACERLGRVLSFPTISSMDAEAVNWQPFDDLRAYMQQGLAARIYGG